ncbi:unnamed protein product [Brassicogethes aeneus]|uniref:Transcription factor cwo n=1 Tax=Brassicogethes aeneus TaxID=1431903 RepID=A0A9P0B5S6_BRAAE|nr:unnamed protein product [Brassicogethes aeneus]
MDMTHTYWEDVGNSNNQRVKFESSINEEPNRIKDDRSLYCCDGNLNFQTATCSEDDCEYGSFKKNKVTRQDPMSHRIIEKRRRDRMNNCLADLSRLIPTEYLKKGRGRIEKTEIIEMAIKHMKYLQQEHVAPTEHYRLGYQECMSETMRFMVEVEGHSPREAICARLLSHLQKHCTDTVSRGPNMPPQQMPSLSPDQMPVHPQESAKQAAAEYQLPKQEPEQNNNNGNGYSTTPSESDYDKHNESGALYKYKTNIKLRFNQDVNGGQEVPNKRPKLENGRRNSVTSLENQSSSHSSPPSSELCTEASHRRSPSDSTASTNHIEQQARAEVIHGYSPMIKSPPLTNFNVPIFALHAKGSYYVPLTIDYKTLMPFLQNFNILEVLQPVHSVVLHPVTISVNFQPSYSSELNGKYKSEWH